MVWRLAKSLEKLRAQINEAAPNRSKSSDGTVGDTAHSARKSDHNPDSGGVVRAMDITHDPLHGVDAGKMADAIRLSNDPRVSYIISNRRIANSGQPWRKYAGSNPHDKHFHVSVVANNSLADDARPWKFGELSPNVAAPAIIAKPILRPGSKGSDVEKLKAVLIDRINREDGFGPITEGAVKGFQTKAGLNDDGVVGPYTWDALT